MKFTNTPTDTILVKANTNSEWDEVDFAILHLNKEEWLGKLEDAVQLSKKYGWFSCIEFWQDVEYYIASSKQHNETIDTLIEEVLGFLDDSPWSYIETTEEELELFRRPEQIVKTGSFSVTPEGYLSHKGYGKHTGEEFFAESIKITDL